MNPRRLVGRSIELVIVLVVLSLVIGGLLGQPVLLSYVETGSMAPAIEAGDGIIAVPSDLRGSVEPGDVIIFRAERLHGGGLVTHRVVGETDSGYITKGDANPFTDQGSSAREPPVQDHQIVAEALQFRGSVVVIPELGSAVETVSAAVDVLVPGRSTGGSGFIPGSFGGLVASLTLLIVLALLIGPYFDHNRAARPRPGPGASEGLADTRRVVAGLAALLILSTTASMAVPAGVQQFGIVSADNDAPGPRVIQKGTTETVSYPVENGGLLPVVVYLEPNTQGVAIDPAEVRVGPRNRETATLTLTAPAERGYYRLALSEHRYLAVLPVTTIRELHSIHPWLPVVVIDILVASGFLGLTYRLVRPGRLRNRRRNVPVRTRIKRLMTRL